MDPPPQIALLPKIPPEGFFGKQCTLFDRREGMGRRPKGESTPIEPKKRGRPAKTLEARENQLISLAMDVAEEQMRNGTASSQIITEFIKRGSTKDQLEKERLRHEVVLIEAKVEAVKSAKTTEELYSKALEAMRSYTGTPVEIYED